MEYEATIILALAGDWDAAREAIPLALTGIIIVFTVLTLLSVAITLLPKVVAVADSILPHAGGHGHGHGPAAPAAAPASDEPARVAAAIAAALHHHRQDSGN